MSNERRKLSYDEAIDVVNKFKFLDNQSWGLGVRLLMTTVFAGKGISEDDVKFMVIAIAEKLLRDARLEAIAAICYKQYTLWFYSLTNGMMASKIQDGYLLQLDKEVFDTYVKHHSKTYENLTETEKERFREMAIEFFGIV